MDDARLGRLVRALRQRRGWRKVDLARHAGVGLSTVANIEFGRISVMQVSSLRAVLAAFGLSYESSVRGMGANEDRLLDQEHATLVGECASWLAGVGWEVRAEISYSEFGERGSIDLLAWHTSSASLLVIEVKTELASIEATLRKLDEKVRLAPAIARRLGWRPGSVSRLVVLPDDRTQRRRVTMHASVLDRAFPMRTQRVRAWSRAPTGTLEGLMFLARRDGRNVARRSRRERIRARTTEPDDSVRRRTTSP
jgi:transcriptional regulator with XRE-family HTH domain